MTERPDLEQRAREMLARECEQDGFAQNAANVRDGLDLEALNPVNARTPISCAIRAITKALASSSVPEQDSWQPIETAPKDGARVLLWLPVGYVTAGSFRTYGETKSWRGDGGNLLKPAHWMPLPPPPAVSGLQDSQSGSGASASQEDGPPYAADDWKEQGYTSPEEEIDDMARVGRALVERIASITKDGPFKGWSPMDCPSEIVTDLINHIEDSAIAQPSEPQS